MKLSVPVHTMRITAEQTALLDSGATENFISHRTWRELGIGRQQLDKPIPVHNVDGTENRLGHIKYYCWLRIIHDKREKLQRFFLTDLGKDRMILGYPFLREFNPPIDWTKGQLMRGGVELQSTKFKHVKGFLKRAHKVFIKTGVLPEKVELFLRKSSLAADWEKRERKRETLPALKGIPEEFRKYWRVFSEELSKQFPPSRNPDMEITLLPDAPTSRKCRPYPRSVAESLVEDNWVKEQEALGRIVQAPSPIVSPIFFIDKKDSDEKRVIMDYRWLNTHTVKDQNPMIRIGDVMESLQGYTVFSKFDLRHGYNNIRIKEEDRYKAAIQTRHGTYIPKVMYFGLCNAPPFFQRTIRRDFQEFLDKYKQGKEGRGGQYMDDFWMASTGTDEGLSLHKEMIHCFLKLCEKHKYYLKASKCEIMQPQMALLGWLVTGEGLRIDPAKVTGISEWPTTLK